MNVLIDEVTSRLRQGLAVETVRTVAGWHVTAPARAEHYERPEASMPDASPRNAPWDAPTPFTIANTKVVYGQYEAWQIEYVGHRPGGDLDVLVSATPYDSRPLAYIAFRCDMGTWRPLFGRWADIATAVTEAERETRFAGWDNPELRGLLNTLEAVA